MLAPLPSLLLRMDAAVPEAVPPATWAKALRRVVIYCSGISVFKRAVPVGCRFVQQIGIVAVVFCLSVVAAVEDDKGGDKLILFLRQVRGKC